MCGRNSTIRLLLGLDLAYSSYKDLSGNDMIICKSS